MTTSAQTTDRRALLQNALRALEEMQTRLDAMERARHEPIAIIGMGCRFPGGANDPEAFWRILRAGTDVIREVPPERWLDAGYSLAALADPAVRSVPWYAGLLDQVDQFDAKFFGIPPREATSLDPQQRLALEVSWETLENAGIAPDSLNGSQTGMFLGISTSDYSQLARRNGLDKIDVYSATGGALNVAAGRVAYTLGLQGPCVAVDTACSSSLVAVHLACQSLRDRESDMALAGGVNVILMPEGFACFVNWGMFARDGRCKTFDARADGFVRSEGCGMIVLKRLSDALAHGDRILALIRGSAVNQDGRSSGLTVPNGPSQQALIRKALAAAGVAPGDIDYMEAHGTGTALGDPIEVEALGAVLGQGRAADHPLILGSVKTNIGHLESAAGIAGVIKVVLALQHGEIPPHLHLRERSPRIPWPDFPILIPAEPMRLPAAGRPPLAGVSAFGLSGTNAHAVIEGPPAAGPVGGPARSPEHARAASHVLTLSTKGKPALKQLAGHYAQWLRNDPAGADLADVCHTANTGRAQLADRLAVVAESPAEMAAALDAFAGNDHSPASSAGAAVIQNRASDTARPRVAFLFTGQGAQYVNMARRLYETQPLFRSLMAQCDEWLRPYLPTPLLSVLYPEAGGENAAAALLDETRYTQPALFALEYALALLWKSWGIVPAAVMGHSVGEYVAACVAGVFGPQDGLRLIAQRAGLMQQLPPGGQMAAVFADEARVRAAIASQAQTVSVAAVNGPENVVISGAGGDVQAVMQELGAHGIQARRLSVSHAFHSALLEPMLDRFERVAGEIAYAAPHTSLISNVTGNWIDRGEIVTAAYWRRHARAPVQFEAGIRTLHEHGCNLFVEIGPAPTLTGMGRRCLPESEGIAWLASLRRGQDDWRSMLECLAALYTHGVAVDWAGVDGGSPRRPVALPTYPFQRERHWQPLPAVASGGGMTQVAHTRSPRPHSALHPLLNRRVRSSQIDNMVFESHVSVDDLPYLSDHQLFGVTVLPAAAYLEMALAAASVLGPLPTVLRDVTILKALALPHSDGAAPTMELVVEAATDGVRPFAILNLDETGSPDGPEAWEQHVTGKIEVTAHEAVTSPAPVSLQDIRAECSRALPVEAYYRQLDTEGMNYGESFRGVVQLWKSERSPEALAEIKLPPAPGANAGTYYLHPALLDACFHPLQAALLHSGVDEAVYVPAGLDALRLYRRAGTRVWCHGRIRPVQGKVAPQGQAQSTVVGDVNLFDDSGQVIAELEGLRLVRVSAEAIESIVGREPDHWMYDVTWQPAPARVETPAGVVPRGAGLGAGLGAWLILADAGGLGEGLAARLHARGERCVMVRPGASFAGPDTGTWQIDPDRPADVERLVRETAADVPLRGVVYLWSLDEKAAGGMTQEPPQDAAVRSCIGVLHLVQALARRPHGQGEAPALWIVTRDAQAVSAQDRIDGLAQSSLWGLGRVIALEHPELRCCCVDLGAAPVPGDAEALFAEVWNSRPHSGESEAREDQVALRDSQRYVARLAPHASRDSSRAVAIHPDATYLITGGMGGLGLSVAKWLAGRGARNLVLIGRTQGTAAARETVKSLVDNGMRIEVVQADVADEAQVVHLLAMIDQAMPPLRGIVHAAGVLDDAVLLQQDRARFERVMNSKVSGAWNLHVATRKLGVPLDFFVLFSSVASVLGSPGQGNYAAANAFLDALAHRRQVEGLPALSINWGAWAEVGMAAALGQRVRHSGMGVMRPDEATRALGRLLSDAAAQVVVSPFDWQRVSALAHSTRVPRLIADLVRNMPRVQATEPPAGSPGLLQQLKEAAPEARRELINGYVRAQVSQVVGLAMADEPDLDAPLSTLGMDSLMAVELRNRVQADAGIAVSVAQLLGDVSVNQLVALLSGAGEEAGAVPRTVTPVVPGEMLDEVALAEFSDEQVEALLSDLLANGGTSNE